MTWWPTFTHTDTHTTHFSLPFRLWSHVHALTGDVGEGWRQIASLHSASNWSLLFLFSSHLLHSLSPQLRHSRVQLSWLLAILSSYLSSGAHSLRVYLIGGISVREQATSPISMKQQRKEKQMRHKLFSSAKCFISLSFALICFVSFIICRWCSFIALILRVKHVLRLCAAFSPDCASKCFVIIFLAVSRVLELLFQRDFSSQKYRFSGIVAVLSVWFDYQHFCPK